MAFFQRDMERDWRRESSARACDVASPVEKSMVEVKSRISDGDFLVAGGAGDDVIVVEEEDVVSSSLPMSFDNFDASSRALAAAARRAATSSSTEDMYLFVVIRLECTLRTIDEEE